MMFISKTKNNSETIFLDQKKVPILASRRHVCLLRIVQLRLPTYLFISGNILCILFQFIEKPFTKTRGGFT